MPPRRYARSMPSGGAGGVGLRAAGMAGGDRRRTLPIPRPVTALEAPNNVHCIPQEREVMEKPSRAQSVLHSASISTCCVPCSIASALTRRRHCAQRPGPPRIRAHCVTTSQRDFDVITNRSAQHVPLNPSTSGRRCSMQMAEKQVPANRASTARVRCQCPGNTQSRL